MSEVPSPDPTIHHPDGRALLGFGLAELTCWVLMRSTSRQSAPA